MVAQVAAQGTVIFNESKTESYCVRHQGGSSNKNITDEFIERLAEGCNDPVHNIEYVLKHGRQLKLISKGNGQYQMHIRLKNLRIEGDKEFRRFDMSKYLAPPMISFTVERLNKACKVIDAYEYKNVPLPNCEDVVICDELVTDTASTLANQGQSLRLANVVFNYNREVQDAFQQQTLLIDEYYGTIGELEEIHRQMEHIVPQDFDHIHDHEAHMQTVRQQIEDIVARDYITQLALSSACDPAGYLPRLAEIDKYALQLEDEIQQTIAQLPGLYMDRGMAKLQNGKPFLARQDFEQAIALAPQFAAPHVEIARLDYGAGKRADAIQRLHGVFGEMQPDEQARRRGLDLAQAIKLDAVGRAQRDLRARNFEAALQQADVATDICRIPGIRCGNEVSDVYRGAHSGIYDRILVSGQAALRAGQYRKAEADAQAALDYHGQFAGFLPGNGAAVQLVRTARAKRYEQALLDGRHALASGALSEAENLTKQAIALAEKHRDAIPNGQAADQLMYDVKQAQYDAKFRQAVRLHDEQKKYAAALDLYLECRAIDQAFGVQRNPEVDLRIPLAARPVVMDRIRRGKSHVRANRLDHAREVVRKVSDDLPQYYLGEDRDIKQALEALKGQIFSQHCANVKARFDQLVLDAEAQARKREYLAASQTYDKALDVARKDSPCQLDMQPVRQAQAAIAPAAAYMRKVLSAAQDVENAHHSRAVSTYIEAGKDFAGEQLSDRFQLHYPSLREFAQTCNRYRFTLHVTDYLIGQDQFEDAIVLLKDLVRRGTRKSTLKPLMDRTGQGLAMRDHDQDSSGDPKRKALRYTNGQKSLKRIYKAYVKQWKRM